MTTKKLTNKHDDDNHNYENNYYLLNQCDYCEIKQQFDYIARSLNNIRETKNMFNLPEFYEIHALKAQFDELCEKMKDFE